jgi:putative transposase
MVILGRMFSWRDALLNDKPDRFIRLAPERIPSVVALETTACWQTSHTQRPGETHWRDGAENPTWGEERIANELKLKLTIQISPRTVGKYLRKEDRYAHPVQNNAG